MYHYYIQSLIDCGMNLEAKEALVNYWGGMIAKGADTFWEAYDPTNDFISPYDFYPINSYCHAWSCTPVYFIRKYPEIFQKWFNEPFHHRGHGGHRGYNYLWIRTLKPLCPLWWKESKLHRHELNALSFYSPPHPISLLYRKSGDIVFNNVSPL